jgi:hypothetical protein
VGSIRLDALVDAFVATTAAVLTGEDFILNDSRRNNTFNGQVMKANDMEDVLKGGDSITDQLILENKSNYGPYNVLQTRSPRLTNHLTEYTLQWATTDASVTFSKHEKGLNQSSLYNRKGRAMVIKDIVKAKWSDVYVGIDIGMDKEWFAQPVATTMETVTSGTRVPYSIFASIHTFGATLTDTFPTATVNPGWTTIQGINPTTFPQWRNPVQGYLGGAQIAAGIPWSGFSASSVMYDRLHFEELSIRPEYGPIDNPDAVILCSSKGKRLWEDAQRASNNYTRHGPSDAAYPGLNYNGVPVIWLEAMDKANVWPATGGTVFGGENNNTTDEDGAATTNPDVQGPRFLWAVPKYVRKYIHSEHFLEMETPPQSSDQPYVRTVFLDCWHQNGTRTRRRAGGILTPATSVTDAAYI